MDAGISSATISPVRLVGLRKVYRRHAALAGVDGELAAGQVSVLMGPNGAGKSTLLGILSTLARPTGGEVFFGSWSHAQAERSLRQTIGFLGHAPLLYPDLSARENLMFFGRLYRLAALPARVEAWLARTGMLAAADRPVRQLSRGMAQRVALGRALLHRPALLLLDEPFTALDRGGVALLREVIRALRAAGGRWCWRPMTPRRWGASATNSGCSSGDASWRDAAAPTSRGARCSTATTRRWARRSGAGHCPRRPRPRGTIQRAPDDRGKEWTPHGSEG
ncbi:MAG: ABC transporter ATP-binding protein [Proteobacteria bacterium]|nr:ABC transporter ATP-binding protein [Pseudomonadota bacterium]